MKVLLINPPRYMEKIPVIREDRCEITERYAIVPPYSLIWIASILREQGHSVTLIDANGLNMTYRELENKMRSQNFDAVIFRFTPTTFDWDMKTAEISKKINPGATTIGLCLTLWKFPWEVLKRARYLDIYVPKEWETVIPNLINALEEKSPLGTVDGISFREHDQIKVTNPAKPIKNYDSLPLPAYDLLSDFKIYRPNTPISGNYMIIYTSKGCPYSCVYCTVARTPFKIKSPERVIEELELLYTKYNVRLVSFFDETFTIDRRRVIKISEYIKKELPELKWYCNTRVNLVDPELLKIMYEGGCRGIAYGVESGSQTILDNAKKGITVEQAKNAIKWTKEAGIKVFTSFIFGLPGETKDTIEETIRFVKETLPHGAQFNVAVPYPGTEFYEYVKQKNLFIGNPSWESFYQHKAVIRTEELSPEELERARKRAYRALYFNPRWIFQNVKWVLTHPEDFILGVRYYAKALKNYLLYRMEHAH
ncbi:B12-binding domain-containing radical SAM protein [Thermococcus aciditolerans]|uniref:Radical SAM protein n=1 Tax=Thermococcus aciditolerans TaxID=2598455 RepID=A0A5C0SKK8_9EURY|nr:radical SAM protein [Thermococcus aciditolerans]QEK14953.1 radical SAM protein [Thermococcus aciditolerans]